MLYIIKWLYAWIMPPAMFLLVGLATVLLFCKTKKKFWLIWLPVLLYGLSIGPVSDRLIKPLEDQYEQPQLTSLRDAQAIVVLGGGSYRGVRDFDGEGQISADAANRLFMGLRLHKALHLPMILSGGRVFSYSATEADIEYRLLKAGGVEEKFLITEANSRNTVENARFTGKLCQQYRFNKVILVTSAYHMPRSVMLFEREGVQVIPCPTDYKTDKETVLNALTFVPNIWSLLNTTTALKEYLGIAAVKAGLQ